MPLSLLWLFSVLGGGAALNVAVTGATGKTGSLAFAALRALDDVETLVGTARQKDAKALKKLRKLCGDDASVDDDLHAIDVTKDADAFAALLTEKKIDALLIATSASPQISKRSLVKVLLGKLLRKKGLRPSFKFRAGGTPEEVDWLGQKAQIDAAVKAGVSKVVVCSSMGGTQPDNFLNSIGRRADGTGGDILKWKRKAEQYAIKSGLTYTILHPGGLLDKPGGRRLVLGVNDELLQRQVRSIPREDVAEVMVQSLFVVEMENRSLDLISEDEPRGDNELSVTLTSSTSLGDCDYAAFSPGDAPSMFSASA